MQLAVAYTEDTFVAYMAGGIPIFSEETGVYKLAIAEFDEHQTDSSDRMQNGHWLKSHE